MANITTPGFQSLDKIDGNNYVAQVPDGNVLAGQVTNPVQIDYNQQPTTQVQDANKSGGVVQGYLNDLLSADSAYMRNAAMTGGNVAAQRGLRNSSIAAGSAQAAGIDAAMPVVNQIMGLHNQREQQAYQAEQNSFDRGLTVAQGNANMANQTQLQNALQAYQAQQAGLDRTQNVNNMVLQAQLQADSAVRDHQFKKWLQEDAVKQQDWLASQSYNREFNGAISKLFVNNATDMFNMILANALENPEVYTPEITAGMQNFYQGNFAAMMKKWFPNMVGGG